jgi:hypothetical protein
MEMSKQQEIDQILARAEREERQLNSRERFRLADLQSPEREDRHDLILGAEMYR